MALISSLRRIHSNSNSTETTCKSHFYFSKKTATQSKLANNHFFQPFHCLRDLIEGMETLIGNNIEEI